VRFNRALKASASVLTAVTLGLTLAACGDDSDHDTSSSSSDTQTAGNGDVFNGADVEFATSMIPHHAQAVQMANMTQGRTLDPAVQQLAEQIRDAQVPEVEAMTDWLTSWDKDVPATSIDHVHGDDMSDMPSMDGTEDMPGMMSADEMAALMNAPDAEFQDMWLEMMTEHHEGAIEMAKTEQQDGMFPDALTLADSIISSQRAEIDQIKQLLAG
jgi:uncharacterized protein (DUF305 family)